MKKLNFNCMDWALAGTTCHCFESFCFHGRIIHPVFMVRCGSEKRCGKTAIVVASFRLDGGKIRAKFFLTTFCKTERARVMGELYTRFFVRCE